ncbi:hypothetical protein COB55_05870, partial [Candidatus Wolfebacteria bacterium]
MKIFLTISLLVLGISFSTQAQTLDRLPMGNDDEIRVVLNNQVAKAVVNVWIQNQTLHDKGLQFFGQILAFVGSHYQLTLCHIEAELETMRVA